MKKLLMTGLLAAIMTTPAFADNAALEDALQEAANMQGYCVDGITTKAGGNGDTFLVAYSAYGSYDENSNSCSGNATWAQLAKVSLDELAHYKVINLNLLEGADLNTIESLQTSGGVATVRGLSYGAQDAQHNPRNIRTIRIRLSDGEILSNSLSGRSR